MVFFYKQEKNTRQPHNIIEKTYSKNHKIIIGDWVWKADAKFHIYS
jgi:hypothetical protein